MGDEGDQGPHQFRLVGGDAPFAALLAQVEPDVDEGLLEAVGAGAEGFGQSRVHETGHAGQVGDGHVAAVVSLEFEAQELEVGGGFAVLLAGVAASGLVQGEELGKDTVLGELTVDSVLGVQGVGVDDGGVGLLRGASIACPGLGVVLGFASRSMGRVVARDFGGLVLEVG
ncbi:hypothetical protein [Streptomyces sp. NPDC051636]|uniref:hypothetical protein n=1 Tax=Streptomyces sp. NPDC051636 TaxID=3365663 RepID=UPI00378D12E4